MMESMVWREDVVAREGVEGGTRKERAVTVMRRRMRGRGQVSGPADITCSAVMHLMPHLLPS